MAVFHNKEQQR